MAIVNEVVTKFGFVGSLAPQSNFNKGLASSVKLLAGMVTAIAGASAAMSAWASSQLGTIATMADLAQTNGIAIESLQELRFAAEQTGGSAESLDGTIERFNRRIGNFAATGAGAAVVAIQKLGLHVRDANGHVKSTVVLLGEVGDKIAGLSRAEQLGITDQFGISPDLIGLLTQGTAGIAAYMAQAKELGVVTAEDAAKAQVYDASLKRLHFGMRAIRQQVAVGMAPALQDLVDKFTALIARNKEWIKDALSKLADILMSLMGMLGRMAPILELVAVAFGVAWLAAGGFATILAFLVSPVVLITAGIAAIVLIVDDLIVAFHGGESVIKEFFDTLGINIMPALQAYADYVAWLFDTFNTIGSGALSFLAGLFKAFRALLTGDLDGAWDIVVDGARHAVDIVYGLFSGLVDKIKTLFSSIGGFVRSAVSGVIPDWLASSIGLDIVPASEAVAAPQVSNSVNQDISIVIRTDNPQAAGSAVQDGLAEQLRQVRLMSGRGGR